MAGVGLTQAKPVKRWAILRRTSRLCIDGERRFIMWDSGNPLLFPTKRAASDYIANKYGYVRQRPELRAYPHGWLMPIPVLVDVSINLAATR